MEKYLILKGYCDKQSKIIERLYSEIHEIDLTNYKDRYVFSLKTQQLYTAIEDMLKQVAKAFENHIDNLNAYDRELLIRLNTDIPNIRPAFLSKESFIFLDKVRAFRHFIRHAYDCELDEKQLMFIQSLIQECFPHFKKDLAHFDQYLSRLTK